MQQCTNQTLNNTEDYVFKGGGGSRTLKISFGKLRSDSDFCDVTLACEDGQQVVLSTSSPFFESLLKRSKRSHPLIYTRGIKSLNLSLLVDFLYFGETSVRRENLEAFLSITDELKVAGLSGDEGAGVGLNSDESIVRISDVERSEEAGQNLLSHVEIEEGNSIRLNI